MAVEVLRRRPRSRSAPAEAAGGALIEFPPRIPATEHELLEALRLVGAIRQVGGKLRASRSARVFELLGRVPSQQEAALWSPVLSEELELIRPPRAG